jgi:hypothetical protein
MKNKLISALFLFVNLVITAQQNKFFIELAKKDLATFNDGITLVRLLYKEDDYKASFIDNILWAAEKKLFKVTIPITSDQINPVLTRREFAYWICKIFNTKGGLVNTSLVFKYSSYRLCVSNGIISKGRGAFDTFTGQELIDTFSYLDYYVKHYNIKPRDGVLDSSNDDYSDIPAWRARLYKELDEQRAAEKQEREKKKFEKLEKRKKKLEEIKLKQKEVEQDKTIEKKVEEKTDVQNQ